MDKQLKLEELIQSIKTDANYFNNVEEVLTQEILDIKEDLNKKDLEGEKIKKSIKDIEDGVKSQIEKIKIVIGETSEGVESNLAELSETVARMSDINIEMVKKETEKIDILKNELFARIQVLDKKKTTLMDVDGLAEVLKDIQSQPVSQPLTLDIYDGTNLLKGSVTKINAPGSTYSNGVVTLVSGGSSLTLKTNNVNNGSQAILNLKQGTNVTLIDDGVGGVTINSGAGSSALSVVSKTADYTATIADDVINCDTSGGPINITVPAANLLTKILRIKITSTSTNTVTLLPTGGGFIDGQGSYNIANPLHKPAVSVISDGTNYQIH